MNTALLLVCQLATYICLITCKLTNVQTCSKCLGEWKGSGMSSSSDDSIMITGGEAGMMKDVQS